MDLDQREKIRSARLALAAPAGLMKVLMRRATPKREEGFFEEFLEGDEEFLEGDVNTFEFTNI